MRSAPTTMVVICNDTHDAASCYDYCLWSHNNSMQTCRCRHVHIRKCARRLIKESTRKKLCAARAERLTDSSNNHAIVILYKIFRRYGWCCWDCCLAARPFSPLLAHDDDLFRQRCSAEHQTWKCPRYCRCELSHCSDWPGTCSAHGPTHVSDAPLQHMDFCTALMHAIGWSLCHLQASCYCCLDNKH